MISYSRRQLELAMRVRARLREHGHAPRIDCLDIDFEERFPETLAWWLSYCDAAVVLLSDDALASPWVRYELGVLVNRERLGEVKLIAVLVDGLAPDELRERRELVPLALDTLQAASLSSQATDAQIDAALDGIAAATGTEHAIKKLVEGVRSSLTAVDDTVRLARARELVPTEVGDDRDPWFDDPVLSDVADSGARLRWALAQELCATPVEPLYAPLQELARDRAGRDRVREIADLSAMTYFDSASIKTLHDEAKNPSRGLVLAFTRRELALLAPQAADWIYVWRTHYSFTLHGPITGRTTEEYVAGIADQLRHLIDVEFGDPDRFIARKRLREHPLLALLSEFDGLTSEILAGLTEAFPDFAFVVLATQALDPRAWSSRLGGLPIAGPHLGAAVWTTALDAETRFVDGWGRTKQDLADLLAEASR